MIELSKIVLVSGVNGPGNRTVIWVQGCPKRCPGCWNPDFLKFGSDWKLTDRELFDRVRTDTNNFSSIEGVTFSGGEPFAQAKALAGAARLFRDAGLSVMSYSGFTLEEIHQKDAAMQAYLSQLDILVDGEYVHELACNRLWRSSANQRVHFLTERYSNYKDGIDDELREFEVVIGNDTVSVTGFPEKFVLK